jgi:Cdc6-like AAA superfamily ATPase
MAVPRAMEIDQAITRVEDDAFDFVPRYAAPLARRITETPASASLTIGIYGPWGSGKTSLMNLIRAKLAESAGAPDKAPVIVTYTAWKYAQEQSLWRTLVRVILDELLKQSDPQDTELQAMRDALYRDVVRTRRRLRVDPIRLAGALTGAATLGLSSWLQARHVPVPAAAEVTLAGIALGGVGVTAFGLKWAGASGGGGNKPDLTQQVGGQVKELAQAFQVVDDVLTTHYRAEHIEQFADSFELVVNRFLNGRKLVIFIDDLDRCLPEKAVQVLEGIKLFLGVPGTVFVLGVDVTALVHAVEVHYAGTVPSAMNGGRYLEKIVQFPFHLPSMRSDEVTTSRLIDQLCSTPVDRDWLRIGVEGFAANPRAVKRFALLYRSRLDVMGGPANLHLAKLVVLQEHPQWRDLIEIILEYTVSSPRSLLREGPLALLERASRDGAQRDTLLLAAERGGLMAILAQLARDDSLMRFLRSEPYFDEDGTDPVDPLPLLRLSGAAPGITTPTGRSLDDVVTGLVSPDPPIRATAAAEARRMTATTRQQLVERLLIEVAARSQNPDPDAAGLPQYVDAVRTCFEQEIERDLITDRLDWFTALADHGLSRLVATRSRQQLLQLTLEINSAPLTFPAFLSDEPTGTDLLDMGSHAQALARTILQTPPPFTVGVFGDWGSGKSSFLMMLREILADEVDVHAGAVNAWAANESDPIAFTQFAFSELLGRRNLGPAATNSTELKSLIATAIDTDAFRGRKLVLLLDDLDRCVPGLVVDALLTMSDVAPESLVLVLAADPRWIGRAFEERFGRGKGQDIAQKLITLQVTMPSVPATALLTSGLADDLGDLAPYIATTPRETKRFVNLLGACLNASRTEGRRLEPRTLAVVLAIALRWPRLIADLNALGQLWNSARTDDPATQDKASQTASDDLELLDPASLISLLSQEPPPPASELARLVDVVRGVAPEVRA